MWPGTDPCHLIWLIYVLAGPETLQWCHDGECESRWLAVAVQSNKMVESPSKSYTNGGKSFY